MAVRIAKPEKSEEDDFVNKVTSFIRLKKSIADLTKEANQIRDELSETIDTDGEEDDTGSRWFVLPEETEGVAALKRERRVSHRLDEDAAEEILTNLKLRDRCYTTIEVLDEDEVYACLAEGLLTEEDIEQIYPAKVSWALLTPKA